MINARNAQQYGMDLVVQFDISEQRTKRMFAFKAEDLTPDSVAIGLVTDEGEERLIYILYSEDFIQSLDYVKEQVMHWYPSEILEILKPKQPIPFEDTAGSQYYKTPDPEEVNAWMQYAVPDDYAYAFLFRVKATAENPSYYT